MPLYEYECTKCGHRTELLQRFSDPPLESCGQCGGEVRKLFSAPAVQFKGTGWYVTDYAGKGKAPPSSGDGDKKAKAGKKEAPAAGSSSGGAKSDSKGSGSKESG